MRSQKKKFFSNGRSNLFSKGISLISRVTGYPAETFVVPFRRDWTSFFQWLQMEQWQERNQNVSQILRALALILANYCFASWHSHTTMFQPSSVKLGTSTIFWNSCAEGGRIVWQKPKQFAPVVPWLWPCPNINILFMPCILYSLKTVALFPRVLKMHIILHIPLLISHVFMYQASGCIIIYITGDRTKKKTNLNNLRGNQNTFGPNQSEMLIFPLWTTATAEYLLFMIMRASHAKFLLRDLWARLHL